MYRFYYLDAFTTNRFEGNPCAVFPEADGMSEKEMQSLAKETNLPETAFVLASDQADFKVRYFTPRNEIPFAGHPTIATAFLLADQGRIKLQGTRTTVQFEFNIGVLPVEVEAQNSGAIERVGMQQQNPVFGETVDVNEFAPLLGLNSADFIPDAPIQVVSTGVAFLMVPLKSVELVRKADMNRPELRKLLSGLGLNAMFVCTPHGFTADGDTFARLMDPDNAGEDPYTGSATGCMGSYFYHYGVISNPRMVCQQGHLLGRPGEGIIQLEGEPGEITNVKLYGKAVASLQGTYGD